MRPKIIAGNWKMNLDHAAGSALAAAIIERLGERPTEAEIVLLPPFTSLPAVVAVVRGTRVRTGAQDLWHESEGAFTGEISAGMLAKLGCAYVLVGHSERRHIIGEEAPLLAHKLRAALAGALAPIYCVGETLAEREAGAASDVVTRQIREVLEGLDAKALARTVIAYEPVWAIGTGRTASPDDAGSMHAVIREELSRLFGPSLADETVILYGGSVKPENARELLSRQGIDGALVGGASLDPDSFVGIIFPA